MNKMGIGGVTILREHENRPPTESTYVSIELIILGETSSINHVSRLKLTWNYRRPHVNIRRAYLSLYHLST